jgi:hypothetical protein
MVDVIAGNATTVVKILDGSFILGDGTDLYALRIRVVGPIVMFIQSYMKGSANPAVYYDLANLTLKISASKVFHGSLGANNPFGLAGVFIPHFLSSHTDYNSDPADAGVTIACDTALGQRYDSFDPQLDFF